MLLQLLVRLSVLLCFCMPVFDETLVAHLSVILVLLVLRFAPQAEQLLRQSLLAVMSYASPLSNSIRSCWCCAAFVTFPLLCTVFVPLRVREKYLREFFLALRALARFDFSVTVSL